MLLLQDAMLCIFEIDIALFDGHFKRGISRLGDGCEVVGWSWQLSCCCYYGLLNTGDDVDFKRLYVHFLKQFSKALLHESAKGALFPCCCRSGGDLDFIGFRFAQMDHSIEHATTDPGFDLLSSPTSSPEPRGEYPLKPEDAGFGQRSSMIATVFFHRFRPFFPMACTRWLRASICRYRRLAFRACALRRGGITDSIGLF